MKFAVFSDAVWLWDVACVVWHDNGGLRPSQLHAGTVLPSHAHHRSHQNRVEYCCTKGRPELLSFSQEYTEYVGGREPMVAVRFLNVDYGALHFHTRSLKINIFNVLFWEGRGHKKGKLSK